MSEHGADYKDRHDDKEIHGIAACAFSGPGRFFLCMYVKEGGGDGKAGWAAK